MKQEKCNITEDIFLSICKAYGRVHRPLDSIRVFHKMKDFECKPTQKSYITVFAILVEENRLKDAMRFYQHMREMGISTSVVSLNILIKALCKNSSTIDVAFRILSEMPNRGCNPNSYTYGTLINSLCRFRKIWEAKELFIEMETKAVEMLDKMKLQGIKPDAGLYGKIINGLCENCKLQEAANFLDEMVLVGISPNRLTWSLHVRTNNIVVQGLCSIGDLNRAFQLDLHKATRLVDEMVLDGCVPDQMTWSVVLCGFLDRRKVWEASKLLAIELLSI
ncbi:pentatricopeptide repeat-containing protein, putative [Ricinus communis]|uniref:Pentatricopeptide repeat-containing protein, putative n=1 Tax=Ricinus communis TaxID=3988 RepID=B9RB93_RICCO|nr:pentatricopeptide repeat-containing protein, putative [Ricinus communis]